MTDEAISPLRRRMIEDMTMRKLAPKTQQGYIRNVKAFAAFLRRSPDTASREDVRRFQLHLTSSGAGTPKINSTVTALRFLFDVTLDRPDIAKRLSFVYEPRKVPVVLSPEEVVRFLEAAPGIKYKAALSVAYGAGLRVSEVVSLKVSDVESRRMVLRVEQGKGRKDRYAMLSPRLLKLLRDWYRIAQPQGWLFPGQNPINPMTTRQLTRACHAAAHIAEITKSGASWSTCCRRASIASDTMGCSPAATEPTTSREHASCSPCRSPATMPPVLAAPTPASR